MTTEYKISNQEESKFRTIFSMMKQQVDAVRQFNNGERNHVSTMLTLLQTQKHLIDSCPEVYTGSEVHFIEWANDQLENNKLPENSSGSFLTAISDLDYILENVATEENYEAVRFLAKQYSL